MWNAPKLNLQPRLGIAYRINDKTAVRFGYALYTFPQNTISRPRLFRASKT